jgi:hypothetical protein
MTFAVGQTFLSMLCGMKFGVSFVFGLGREVWAATDAVVVVCQCFWVEGRGS